MADILVVGFGIFFAGFIAGNLVHSLLSARRRWQHG